MDANDGIRGGVRHEITFFVLLGIDIELGFGPQLTINLGALEAAFDLFLLIDNRSRRTGAERHPACAGTGQSPMLLHHANLPIHSHLQSLTLLDAERPNVR